jgi:transposase-like protein
MTVAKRVVPKELLDSLLAEYRKPEDLIGENGLLKQLTKLLVERALEAEMADSSGSWQKQAGSESDRQYPQRQEPEDASRGISANCRLKFRVTATALLSHN